MFSNKPSPEMFRTAFRYHTNECWGEMSKKEVSEFCKPYNIGPFRTRVKERLDEKVAEQDLVEMYVEFPEIEGKLHVQRFYNL